MSLNSREPWLSESAVVPVPHREVVDALRDPDTIPGLFPGFGIEIDPHRTVDTGTRLHLARVALDSDVVLHVAGLEIDRDADEMTRIILEIERSRRGQGTTIVSSLSPHQSHEGMSQLDFDVFPPPEGGPLYSMPFAKRIVSGVIQHELGQIPDRFETVRDRPTA